MEGSSKTVLVLFGTRPETIKLAPVIHEIEEHRKNLSCTVVRSGQHTDLVEPFVKLFGIRPHYELGVMQNGQTPSDVCARVLERLDPILARESPDLLLVQGDTTTAMAGALAAYHRQIPVGHVEAGLRTGDPLSPFPEEMNRRLISRLATFHYAATDSNRTQLLSEGVEPERIFLTGNPVVDALQWILRQKSAAVAPEWPAVVNGKRRIVLTTHRRESFGQAMAANLRALREFVETHTDVCLIFPVHPNPNVTATAESELGGHARILLVPPMGYPEFTHLLSQAWLIVSDSGGVQEEAPTLRRPLLILREKTERPESVQCGVARLVGGDASRLMEMLEEAYRDPSWEHEVCKSENPFGRGDSAKRIVDAIEAALFGDATNDNEKACHAGHSPAR